MLTTGKWIKDGFITYGNKDWHYFSRKGKISACNMVLAHQRGWEGGSSELPASANKMNTCLLCKKIGDKITSQATHSHGHGSTDNAAGTCGKVEYFSEAEAFQALLHITHKHKKGRNEARAYHCSTCNSWHLTSRK
jgi:hypothetical protein